ncbi:MAG: hypothetical protein MHMPM18_002946 [Marteilia pararefringens]
MFHNSKIPATPSISTIFDNQNPESSQQNSNISQEKSDTVMQQLSKTFQEVLSVGIKSKFGNTEMLKAPEESNIPFDDNRQSKYIESVCNINEDPKTPVIYSKYLFSKSLLIISVIYQSTTFFQIHTNLCKF